MISLTPTGGRRRLRGAALVATVLVSTSSAPVVVGETVRAEETRHEVIVIDHALPMWSAWTLETGVVRAVDSSTSDGTPRQ